MTSPLRVHLEDVANELAATISHPAYLLGVRDIYNAPRERQYEMAEALTTGWAAAQGVPVSARLRSVPRTFENPAHAVANGVQVAGCEPGTGRYGEAPADSYDQSSWKGEGNEVIDTLASSEVVARAVREELGAIIDFVDSLPFQLLLAELRFTPYDERPRFVLDVILDKAEREDRGVFVPDGMLIQRSTFHDGRPTLFCVSTVTQLAAPWRKLTFTFDNASLSA